jgi:hypothetical protein
VAVLKSATKATLEPWNAVDELNLTGRMKGAGDLAK